MNLAKLKKLAKSHGWDLHDYQQNIEMVSFVKVFKGDPARINIYITKMTVATCITHPRQGKTQLFRKKVGDKLMGDIFKNPRVHTDKGYQRK